MRTAVHAAIVLAVLGLVGLGIGHWAIAQGPPPPAPGPGGPNDGARPNPPQPPHPGMGPDGFRGFMGPGAGLMDPGGMGDKDIRELIETVRMVRLSQSLGLKEEDTVLLIGRYNKYREQLQKLNRERPELMRDLREAIGTDAPDDKIQAALDKVVDHDKKVADLRNASFNEIGKNLTAKQKAKLFIFMHEFDQEMRRLIERAREGGPGMGMGPMPGMGGPMPGMGMGMGPMPGMGPMGPMPPNAPQGFNGRDGDHMGPPPGQGNDGGPGDSRRPFRRRFFQNPNPANSNPPSEGKPQQPAPTAEAAK